MWLFGVSVNFAQTKHDRLIQILFSIHRYLNIRNWLRIHPAPKDFMTESFKNFRWFTTDCPKPLLSGSSWREASAEINYYSALRLNNNTHCPEVPTFRISFQFDVSVDSRVCQQSGTCVPAQNYPTPILGVSYAILTPGGKNGRGHSYPLQPILTPPPPFIITQGVKMV